MAHAIWKGSLNFGLVSIPVTLTTAEQPEDTSFTLVDKRDKSPIGYRKINKRTGEDVENEFISKAYEYREGEYILVPEEELKKAHPERTQRIELIQFVDAEAIEPAYFLKPYYLEPLEHSEKAYELLREALERSRKIGIARVVIHAREYVGALTVTGAVLELDLLRYTHELRNPNELNLPDPKKHRPSEGELRMAERLIEDLSAPWRPEAFKDEYREYLLHTIERKAKAAPAKLLAKEEELETKEMRPAAAGDIMALLRASLEHTSKK